MEEFKEEVDLLNENYQVKLNEFIDSFDEDYETNIKERIKQKPLLCNLFEKFTEEIYAPTKFYNKTKSKMIELEEEIKKTYCNENKLLHEKWQFLQDRILDDMLQQAFVYGYCLANQLNKESE